MIHVQDDVWHMTRDKTTGLGYASTYSKFKFANRKDRSKFFGVRFEREYIYEISTTTQAVSKVFSASVTVPLHLNSDMVVANRKLFVACGSAHDAFSLSLDDFASWQTVPGGPILLSRWANLGSWVNWIQNMVDGFTHFEFALQPILIILRTNRRLMNGIYALSVSPCRNYLCLGHRDYNFCRIIDINTFRTVASFYLPTHGEHAETSFFGLVTRHRIHHSRTAPLYEL